MIQPIGDADRVSGAHSARCGPACNYHWIDSLSDCDRFARLVAAYVRAADEFNSRWQRHRIRINSRVPTL